MNFSTVKFLYFSHQTLQVPRVARQCMVAVCEAAAQLGADSEIVSFVANVSADEPHHAPFEQLYGVTAPLKHTAYRIYGANVDKGGRFVDLARLFVYSRRIVRFLLRREHRQYRCVVVSSRNYSILLLLVLAAKFCRNMIVLADVHGMTSSRSGRLAHRTVHGNVCISQSLADDLAGRFSLPADRVRVAHSGVRPERFALTGVTRQDARARLELPQHKTIVCYTGKVYYRYGEVAYLIEAARRVDEDVVMLIVGGRPDQVAQWRNECLQQDLKKIIFRSFVPPSEVPLYLRSADLLVMYYSPSPLNDYRSPGKLFEYLASGTPMIAARTRSVEEVVTDGRNGYLVEPYRPELLSAAIQRVASDSGRWSMIGENAVATAHEYTWGVRAGHFLQFGNDLLKTRGEAR